MMRQLKDRTGFTLIEMIVVIVIVGILSALGGMFIVKPVTGYVDLARRTRLVDQAEMAVRRLQRDIRHALPNSIPAVTNASSLSLEVSLDGGRYRRYPGGGWTDFLSFTNPDSSFEILGQPNAEVRSRLDGSGNVLAGEEIDVVIYNTSPVAVGNREGISAIVTDSSDPAQDHYIVFLAAAKQFPYASPAQRFYILDRDESAVTYAWVGNDLLRNGVIVTRNVADCQFTYDSGASERAGLVTLKLTLTESGESVSMLHQIHVVNVP